MSTFVNISEASTIALHSMALIANNKEKLNAKKLADLTGFSKNHLAKVLHILVKHNYLSSLRGPTGGYQLIRKASDISLFEIYKLIEGELSDFQCAVACEACYFETCLFGNWPHEFSNSFSEFLKEKSLNDFKLKAEK